MTATQLPVTPSVLHSLTMPTKHRRIALTADPELELAIAAARKELGDLPESRLVRELAIRGSRELDPDPLAGLRAKWEAEGVEWPAQSMSEALAELPPLGPVDPDDPYRMTRILNEVREDTV
jgi:hypothetical protein